MGGRRPAGPERFEFREDCRPEAIPQLLSPLEGPLQVPVAGEQQATVIPARLNYDVAAGSADPDDAVHEQLSGLVWGEEEAWSG